MVLQTVATKAAQMVMLSGAQLVKQMVHHLGMQKVLRRVHQKGLHWGAMTACLMGNYSAFQSADPLVDH